jgi:hypothetical protein
VTFRLIAAALLAVSAAAPQQVISGEEGLLHRAAIRNPGGEGLVEIEATLNERGIVTDARVLSGPQPLRRDSLISVLDWHYAPGTASPVRIAIRFARQPVLLNGRPAPEGFAPATIVREPLPGVEAGVLQRIRFTGVAPQTEKTIRAALPVRQGETIDTATVARIAGIVREADEHLSVKYQLLDFDGERRTFALEIR